MEVPYRGIVLILDEEDVHYIYEHTWAIHTHKRKHGDLFYLRYRTVKDKQVRYVYLHRLIMGLPPAADSDLCVDHIEHNTLDNRKSNLRVTTKKENSRNGTLRPNNVSGYTGVTYTKNERRNKRYVAWICVDFKNIYLGAHTTAERAAHAYDWWAIKYFGEYASLNFPDFDYVNCNSEEFLSNEKLVAKNNSSGITGVSYDKEAGKWAAYTPRTNGKIRRIGRYATKELAANARENWIKDEED